MERKPYCVSVFTHIPANLTASEALHRGACRSGDCHWVPWKHPSENQFRFCSAADANELLTAVARDVDAVYRESTWLTRGEDEQSVGFDEWTGLWFVVIGTKPYQRNVDTRAWYKTVTKPYSTASTGFNFALSQMTSIPLDVVLDGYAVTLAELSSVG